MGLVATSKAVVVGRRCTMRPAVAQCKSVNCLSLMQHFMRCTPVTSMAAPRLTSVAVVKYGNSWEEQWQAGKTSSLRSHPAKSNQCPWNAEILNPIRLWLTEIDEHLQIYSGAFEGLGFKSPDDSRKHWHHRDDTHLQDLFRQIGIRKLGHKRLLQRWLSHPKPILSDL